MRCKVFFPSYSFKFSQSLFHFSSKRENCVKSNARRSGNGAKNFFARYLQNHFSSPQDLIRLYPCFLLRLLHFIHFIPEYFPNREQLKTRKTFFLASRFCFHSYYHFIQRYSNELRYSRLHWFSISILTAPSNYFEAI